MFFEELQDAPRLKYLNTVCAGFFGPKNGIFLTTFYQWWARAAYSRKKHKISSRDRRDSPLVMPQADDKKMQKQTKILG